MARGAAANARSRIRQQEARPLVGRVRKFRMGSREAIDGVEETVGKMSKLAWRVGEAVKESDDASAAPTSRHDDCPTSGRTCRYGLRTSGAIGRAFGLACSFSWHCRAD